jgi:PPOX class probable F420-dependent enzyme
MHRKDAVMTDATTDPLAGISTRMSLAEISLFLGEARHAIAGVIRSDGAPQLSPIWFLFEGGKVYFSILVASAKFRQLEQDPRMSLCIDAGHPDARAVMIRGRAELIRERSAWSDDVTERIERRYFESDEAAQEYRDEMGSQGDGALVVLSPDRIWGRDFN